jgi:ketosteroid isomerase-like protein
MARDFTKEDSNKALVQASFNRWKNGTGGPFELLATDVEWTIVGSSPLLRLITARKNLSTL